MIRPILVIIAEIRSRLQNYRELKNDKKLEKELKIMNKKGNK